MVFRDFFDEEQLRIRVLQVLMISTFVLVLAVLWRMQVAQGKSYQKDLIRQSVRRVRLPGMRGRLFDRNGNCVADNRPSYCIAVYLEELRMPGRWSRTIDRVDDLLDELALILELPRQLTRDDIKKHIRKRLPLPLLAWRDVDEIALARLAENAAAERGVDVYIEAVREYPYGDSACHTLGYVGRADIKQNKEEPYHYYLPEMAGRSGLEKTFDGVLRGEPGGRLVRVNVSGFRYDDLAVREPHNGLDIHLTLDMRIQRLAEEVMRDKSGSVVIVDPRNGDVLAIASSPGFDLNDFVPAISISRWNELLRDERKPLLNRAVAGSYPPGSTFKPVVAFAALENDKATPATTFSCPGYFNLGKARFNCWYSRGHGSVDMVEALQHSCNVYFFRLGLQTGLEPIYHMAAAFGLGKKTDVTVDYEVSGLLPNDGWKRRRYGDAWRDGDTCNLSIGQGALLVTPLQMAMLTATIANGGHLYRPRLAAEIRDSHGNTIRAFPSKIANELNWSDRSMRTVRKGMKDVVMSSRGSGRLARARGVEMAGKTGTAEYGKKDEGKNLAWMIAFAPFENPRYAVVVLVEDGVSGGSTAAPLVKKIMTGLFVGDDKGGQG